MISRYCSLRAASIVAMLVVPLAAMACSNQGEGERCSTKADNDCAAGLTCMQIEGQPEPLCCPLGRTSSVAQCIPGPKLQDAAVDTESPDAGSEASIGDASDAAIEADASAD